MFQEVNPKDLFFIVCLSRLCLVLLVVRMSLSLIAYDKGCATSC